MDARLASVHHLTHRSRVYDKFDPQNTESCVFSDAASVAVEQRYRR